MNTGASMLNAATALTAQPSVSDLAGVVAGAEGEFNAVMAATAAPAVGADALETATADVPLDAAGLALLAALLPTLQQEEAVAPAVAEGSESIDADALLAGSRISSQPVGQQPAASVGMPLQAQAQSPKAVDPLTLALAAHGDQASTDTQPDDQVADPLAMVSRMLSAAGETSASAGSAPDGTTHFTHALHGLARDVAMITASPEARGRAAVHTPVGTPRWADDVGSKVMLMSLRGQQEGSLTLSPEHLGPLEVRISVGQDSTNVWFGAQHAETRAALSEALPRLRELFAASGLALGQAGVSQDMPRQEARDAGGGRAAGDAETAEIAEASAPPVARPLRSALLDAWA